MNASEERARQKREALARKREYRARLQKFNPVAYEVMMASVRKTLEMPANAPDASVVAELEKRMAAKRKLAAASSVLSSPRSLAARETLAEASPAPSVPDRTNQPAKDSSREAVLERARKNAALLIAAGRRK